MEASTLASIMKGGAAGHDGRIEPGDMLLQVPLPTLVVVWMET